MASTSFNSFDSPESQDALFHKDDGQKTLKEPPELARAVLRLQFPPSYVAVGVYRLFTDKALYGPAWKKCKHGTVRGAAVGAGWAFFTYNIQRGFIKVFLKNSPRVTGLSNDTMFGYKIPFDIHTYAALLFLGSQMTFILRFFLSRNIVIARERAWAQTVVSRGKPPEFWQPYVEEWDVPPKVDVTKPSMLQTLSQGTFGRMVIKRIVTIPFAFYPFVGVAISAYMKALGTARYLHKQYFQAKKMTDHQVAVFVEERKWDYRLFGFAAALLEGLPIVGLVFSISNRVGAAMWAHDLEKRQHFVAKEKGLKTQIVEPSKSSSSL